MDLNTILALVGVAVASVTDGARRKVPNWLTVPLIVGGVVLGVVQGGGAGLLGAVAGSLFGLLLFIFPFAMGWVGGGDVKLLAALGALLGARGVLWSTLYGAVAGGLCALGLVAFRLAVAGQLLIQLRIYLTAALYWCAHRHMSAVDRHSLLTLPATKAALQAKFPYALPIAAGTLLAVLTDKTL